MAHKRARPIPLSERDACGVAGIARLSGTPDTDIINQALDALTRFEHRGGQVDATGDGAGVLLQIDRDFFLNQIPPGRRPAGTPEIGVATVFLPHGERANDREMVPIIRQILRRHGLEHLSWRPVPVNPKSLGSTSRHMMPDIVHVIFRVLPTGEDIIRRCFRARLELQDEFQRIYIASMSSKTIVYKALATAPQFVELYPDLTHGMRSAMAILHRRFSTNTISNWMLTQSFRFIAHNGEINSIRANRAAIKDLARALGFPSVLQRQGSDSADFDRALELLVVHGIPLTEAIRRMMPPAHRELVGEPRGFGEFLEGSRRVMGALGAFEGPAAIIASDGDRLVGVVDRMGLRPLRYCRTATDTVWIGSEMGPAPFAFDEITLSGQLDPGEMIEADLVRSVLNTREAVHAGFVQNTTLDIASLTTKHLFVPSPIQSPGTPEPLLSDLLARFGWDKEHQRVLHHMAKEAKEPITSMGNDRPLAVLQTNPATLYDYFHQIVAVVTNPPIDSIREGGAMDLSVYLGRHPSLEPKSTALLPAQYLLDSPVITNATASAIKSGNPGTPIVHVVSLAIAKVLDPLEAEHKLEERILAAVQAAQANEADILWISDRGGYTNDRVPLPVLLAVGGIHNRLTGLGLRRRVSIVAEAGDAVEAHDIAVLLAEGADAVSPYLVFDHVGEGSPQAADAVHNVHHALDQTIRRIMSKMGITSVEGYIGSKLFEAVGISEDLIDRYLRHTPGRIGGVDFRQIFEDIVARSSRTAADLKRGDTLPAYRKEVTDALQEVARGDVPNAYRHYLELVAKTPPTYLRDLMEFRLCLTPLTPDQIESEESIIQTVFRGAAMSMGALSAEAHRAIAQAFNELGALSNSGEGGEDTRRNIGGPWQSSRSRVRQVASGRFGVDAEYLVNADELEIKIGQGAKPGEGGHLPGFKVTAEIARIRKTPEGISLISPPPHHDIYSIEDLAQLIDSLRQTHPAARISVKCPTTSEIATIAVGVAKAGADIIAISGFEGGTGAAAKSSIEHAGLPLERGLADVHQALLAQGIRDRILLRADGGIKTGLDVAKVLALGANSISFGTLLMVAEQCIYCRGCSAGKCPTGITTHDPKYKKRFLAKILSVDAEAQARIDEAAKGVRVVLTEVARELRALLGAVGLRTAAELVGRNDLLVQRRTGHRKLDSIELASFLEDTPTIEPDKEQRPSLRPSGVYPLNQQLVQLAEDAISGKNPKTVLDLSITNADRSTGATLAGRMARAYQIERGVEGTVRRRDIELTFTGYAGQGFGFAAVDGMKLRLKGFANDTVGEVMSAGAQIIIQNPCAGPDRAHLVGNAACYGATGGALYIAGAAGQRLGVRNSGATIVAEAAGKYPFEYMTDGVGVLLAASGPVIGSGLTGGTLYLLDEDQSLADRIHSDAAIVPLEAADHQRLRTIIEDFTAETSSIRGKAILKGFDEFVPLFRKVVPKDVAAQIHKPSLAVIEGGAP